MKSVQLVASVALSALTSLSAMADLIRVSQIVDFSTGSLGADATTGQLDQWFQIANPGTVTLTNGSGSLDGTGLGLVASSGDRVFISATDQINTSRNQFATNTTYPQGVETNLYFSFLYKFNNAADVSPNGEVMIRVNRANSGTGTAQHWDLLAKNVGGQIQIGVSKAGAPNNATNYATTNIAAGQTVFLVVRQHIVPLAQNDVYDLWINPPPQFFGTNEVDIPPPSASIGALTTDGTEDSSGTGPGRFVVCSGLNAEFDEFRVATTWADATPWFGQCLSAVAQAISPATVTQSAGLSTTFRVAAFGTSPTIQWQRSTNSGSTWDNIPGATASLYTTPNLTLVDSGIRYRAVVSVACNGTSANSPAASVTLTNPIATPVGAVMNDTFTDPELGFDDRSNPPLTATNSLWYTATSDNLVADQAGNMVGTPLEAGSSLWLGYFVETNQPPVHLAVGRAINAAIRFTPNSFNAFTNNAGLRFGLFDYHDSGNRITADGSNVGGSQGSGTGVRGYMVVMDFGTNFSDTTPMEIYARSFLPDSNLMGTTSDYESLASGPEEAVSTNTPSFVAGFEYRMELQVLRVAENSVTITATVEGPTNIWQTIITDNNYAYHRFDAFAIRPERLQLTADSFTFPQFTISVTASAIPVPPFKITAVEPLSPTAVKLTWESQPGATYHVLARGTLTGGETTNHTVTATGTLTSYTNSPTSGNETYYRVLGLPYMP